MRTEVTKTTIGGVTQSGIMPHQILAANPDVFCNAIILSPLIWLDYDKHLTMDISSKLIENQKIIITVGEDEGKNMVQHLIDVYEKFKELGLD